MKLRKVLKKYLGRRIRGGPFKGMHYSGESHNSTFLPKIVGTYEVEIAKDMVSLISGCQRTIVDIGCAEGYYANGALMLNQQVKVIGFEVDPQAKKACQAIASRNGYGDRLLLKEYCDEQSLKETLAHHEVDLLIVDIEGFEEELLEPLKIPELMSIRILVEVHDFVRPGLSTIIKERFSASHRLKHIAARQRSWRDIEIGLFQTLARSHPKLENALLSEQRPNGMSWIVMEPIP